VLGLCSLYTIVDAMNGIDQGMADEELQPLVDDAGWRDP
jgi:hypothetical protein